MPQSLPTSPINVCMHSILSVHRLRLITPLINHLPEPETVRPPLLILPLPLPPVSLPPLPLLPLPLLPLLLPPNHVWWRMFTVARIALSVAERHLMLSATTLSSISIFSLKTCSSLIWRRTPLTLLSWWYPLSLTVSHSPLPLVLWICFHFFRPLTLHNTPTQTHYFCHLKSAPSHHALR